MRALRAGLILGLLTGHVLSVGEADPCISQMPEIAGIEQLMDAVQRAFTRWRFAVVGLWPTATQQASASESAAGVTDLELVLRASQTANKQMLLDVCRNLRYLIDVRTQCSTGSRSPQHHSTTAPQHHSTTAAPRRSASTQNPPFIVTAVLLWM
jgi:hypothetical protein